MSIKVEVKNATCAERQVNIKAGSRAGQTAVFREQVAYAHLLDRQGNPKPYPVEVSVNVEDGAAPYAPGLYTIAPGSFYVDKFGGLSMGRVRLVPIKSAA